MPDTNEYITKLMNRNDDDLDDILSFADNIRSHVSMKKEKKDADDILDEILSSNHISAEDPVKSEIHSTEKHINDQDSSAFSTHILPVVHNYHHVLISPDQFRCTPFQKKNPETECTVIRNPIISDNSHEEIKSIEVSQEKDEQPIEREPQNNDVPEINHKQKYSIFDEIDESDHDNAEEFIKSQSMKHPKFYLILGISIFFLTLFGIASFVYLGLNAMRKFCETYS